MLNKFLGFIAVLLLVVIGGGTWIAFEKKKIAPQDIFLPAPASDESRKLVNRNSGLEHTVDSFSELGQIRTMTKAESDGTTAVVAVSPWFSYPAGDTALHEELATKEKQISTVFSQYFSTHTVFDLRKKGEMQVKEDLLELVNDQLVLGKIRGVFFNEYVFID